MQVFLASPFTAYLARTDDGVQHLNPDLVAFLLRIEAALLKAGHSVFIAHRREAFGVELLSGEQCTPLDYLEMQLADCVIALPERSYGVHIELGWATALRKPTILLIDGSTPPTSPLLVGLNCIGTASVVKVPADLFMNPPAQERLCARLVALLDTVSQSPKQQAVAFLSTSFGFGPVSKASTIAHELKLLAPDLELHYIGAGVGYDFACKSGTFDRVLRVDVDDHHMLLTALPALRFYQFVFSILNLDILTIWPASHPPLYFVDSLAWMWPSPPPGLRNAQAYFMQDYLVPRARFEDWRDECSVVRLVGPIRRDIPQSSLERTERDLLVNFSGCSSPYTDAALFEQYVELLARAVLTNAVAFDRVIFCCNEHLSHHLRARIGTSDSVLINHFPHESFLHALAAASAILTAPGITTTLEASALKKPIRFLLPQNYSQALMSEHYRSALGDHSGMALSRFGLACRLRDGLPEAEGLAVVLDALSEILRTRESDIGEMIRQLLADQAVRGPLDFPLSPSSDAAEPGQRTIAIHALSAYAHAGSLPVWRRAGL